MERLSTRCLLHTPVGALVRPNAKRKMYILSVCHAAEDGVPLGLMNIHGVYHSLNAAIKAAINTDIDLETAVIEKENGVQASVNDWIAVRIAGGDLGVSRRNTARSRQVGA